MTLDTTELRRLHGAATGDDQGQRYYARTCIVAAAPALLNAADRLARIEAVLAGDEAVEVMQVHLLGFNHDDELRSQATAALAALRELIGGV